MIVRAESGAADEMVGGMTRALGSIDVTVNAQLFGSRITAWTPGGYRSLQWCD